MKTQIALLEELNRKMNAGEIELAELENFAAAGKAYTPKQVEHRAHCRELDSALTLRALGAFASAKQTG